MDRMGASVMRAFRPLVQIDDEEFERVVREGSRLKPVHEAIAFGVGAIFGLSLIVRSLSGQDFYWLMPYWFLTTIIMYGLLTWTIVASVADTRVMAALHRQPLRINLFDTSPFEAIGNQSLVTSLAFVGGITLSVVLGGYGPDSLHLPEFWLTYGVLTAAPILIFFLTMNPTHRVMADAKARETERVNAQIHRACQTMLQRVEEGKGIGDFAQEISALAEYEHRLKQAKTWPYDTAKLSTLSISVLAPVATTILRWFAEQLVK